MIRSFILAACAASLAACGPTGGVASASSTPATVAAVADATLPPPSAVSPLAQTQIDDAGIVVAFQTLDVAASAADLVLKLRSSFAGTPLARRLADGLAGAKTWLNIGSKAQRAGQAESYKAALEQASAALTDAKGALSGLEPKK